MTNKNQGSQFDLLSKISQDIFFHYDLKTRVMQIPKTISQKLFLKEIYYPMPEAFIEQHIFEEDKKKVYEFFNENGKKDIRFRLITNNQKVIWYKGVACNSLTSSDSITGYLRDINYEVELEMEKEKLKMLSVIQNCMLMAPNNTNESFKFLDYLTSFFEASQSFIALYDSDLEIKFTSNHVVTDNIFSDKEKMYLLDKKYLKHTNSSHLISDLEEFNDVDTFVEVPLFGSDGSTMGILGIVNAKKEKINEKLLTILSSSLSLTMQNLLYNLELEKHSTRDLLTGVKNRNAYETYLYKFNPELLNSLGLIVVDINGLKVCNDTAGHNAGDLLIQTVASGLANVFGNDNVYRFGGDEFVVVCENIKEDFLKQKIELFRFSLSNASVSLGYAFDRSTISIKDMQNEADAKMYLDKEKFYQEHSEFNARKN